MSSPESTPPGEPQPASSLEEAEEAAHQAALAALRAANPALAAIMDRHRHQADSPDEEGEA